ncbi:hypothetical protein N7486_002003, partial [Penicillium sp. IBT 16267x]
TSLQLPAIWFNSPKRPRLVITSEQPYVSFPRRLTFEFHYFRNVFPRLLISLASRFTSEPFTQLDLTISDQTNLVIHQRLPASYYLPGFVSLSLLKRNLTDLKATGYSYSEPKPSLFKYAVFALGLILQALISRGGTLEWIS